MSNKCPYQVFSDMQWLYPDTIIDSPCNEAVLYSARNTDVCFQVLTDMDVPDDASFSFELSSLPCKATVYQLAAVPVSMNSAKDVFTTADYDSVKHFVTRKAPFDVYDITKDIENGRLSAGRAAFFVRLDVPSSAPVSEQNGNLLLNIGSSSITVPISLKIYNATVPDLKESAFHMVNWIYFYVLAAQHGCPEYSDAYMELLSKYLENQIDMRNDTLMLPSGEPVRDKSGYVIDFDFSKAEKVGSLALEKGFRYVMGGFCAHWSDWRKPELYLLWDKETDTASIEGFRQLKLYFTRAYESVVRQGWKDKYMQCLVDEPQFVSSGTYRILSGICRQNMPEVKINDPVETTEIGGALDVWVVKQAIYEKYITDYQKLQSYGEEMWLYTCGFPAGVTMNRVMDLPLTVSRMPMWLCFKYGCPGFLHWGYHFSSKEAMLDGATDAPGRDSLKYPPGNAHVIYCGDGAPIYSIRGHAQRTGAADYELLNLLAKTNKIAALETVNSLCRTFDDYDPTVQGFENARKKLLDAIG